MKHVKQFTIALSVGFLAYHITGGPSPIIVGIITASLIGLLFDYFNA